ncbi:MAG TPA: hypothetical protein VHA78_04730 [Candidatus Peribacteraceae bacterium]|nr:hypothetical protein [Candidatus Peribacteraceae bacterium]
MAAKKSPRVTKSSQLQSVSFFVNINHGTVTTDPPADIENWIVAGPNINLFPEQIESVKQLIHMSCARIADRIKSQFILCAVNDDGIVSSDCGRIRVGQTDLAILQRAITDARVVSHRRGYDEGQASKNADERMKGYKEAVADVMREVVKR